MSASHDIIIRRDGAISTFTDDVSKALGLKFESTDSYVNDAGYWAVAGEYGVGISHADYDEPIDDYQFAIEVAANDETAEERVARDVFEKLKALSLPMVLFFNMDIELDRYDPPSPAA